jgi:hypothetical protein
MIRQSGTIMTTEKIRRILPALQHDELYARLTSAQWKRLRSDDLPETTLPVASCWTHDDFNARVVWLDDQEISRHFYGIVFGADATAAAARLEEDAWHITIRQAIASFRYANTIPQLGSTAICLGLLACGPFDKDVFNIICCMLTGGHPELQADALTAVLHSAWPQFDPIVEQLSVHPEACDEIRSEAARVLVTQRERDWNSELR